MTISQKDAEIILEALGTVNYERSGLCQEEKILVLKIMLRFPDLQEKYSVLHSYAKDEI